MKIKLWMNMILIIESALVLIGLTAGQNMWVGIICYWVVLLMKNITDAIEELRNGRKHKGQV